jgi:branched-subunit amino acid transport protein
MASAPEQGLGRLGDYYYNGCGVGARSCSLPGKGGAVMSKLIAAVILMAVVTYIPRLLPIGFFTRRIQSNFVKSFLFYVPYAVLGAMTFPGILFSTSNIYFALAGTAAALILAFLEKGLLKVAIGAVLVVYLCELFIR